MSERGVVRLMREGIASRLREIAATGGGLFARAHLQTLEKAARRIEELEELYKREASGASAEIERLRERVSVLEQIRDEASRILAGSGGAVRASQASVVSAEIALLVEFLEACCVCTGRETDSIRSRDLSEAFSFWLSKRREPDWPRAVVALRLADTSKWWKSSKSGFGFTRRKCSHVIYRGICLDEAFSQEIEAGKIPRTPSPRTLARMADEPRTPLFPILREDGEDKSRFREDKS